MRGLEELEAAVFHEGDLTASELDLEDVAVTGGAEEHRLLAQRHARLRGASAPRPHTYSACACRSSTVTRRGRGPSPRVDNKVLAVLAGASAIRALATSSTCWVER